MPTGSSTPLAICAGGHAMMASMSSEEVTRIALRYNAEAAEGASLVRVRQLHEDLELVRERGYAAVYDAVLRGGALVAARLPQIEGQRQMVIAVGGQSAVIREAEAEIAGAILAGIADLADSTRGEALPDALAPLEAEHSEVLRSA
jgi:DNA-binding IclR family transcriptional regulator